MLLAIDQLYSATVQGQTSRFESLAATTFDPQPSVPVVRVQPIDVAEDDDAEDIGEDEPLNSVDDVELIQDDSNVELFDLENVEEVTVPFDLSEKLEILNERRTE